MNCSSLLFSVRATSVTTSTTQQLLFPEPERSYCFTFRRKLAQTSKLDPILTLNLLEVLRPGHLVCAKKQRQDPRSGVRGGFCPESGAFRTHGTHLCTVCSYSLLPVIGIFHDILHPLKTWGEEEQPVLTCKEDGFAGYLFTDFFPSPEDLPSYTLSLQSQDSLFTAPQCFTQMCQ